MAEALIRKNEIALKDVGVYPFTRNRDNYLKTITQNSSEWAAARSKLLGASELPQAIRCSPHGSPDDYLKSKFGKRRQTEAMKRGSAQEASALELCREVHKVKITCSPTIVVVTPPSLRSSCSSISS